MSDSRLYSRLLLSKGHGYPLFHPQPFDDLPEEARRIGTEIGDVGVVTSDGSFDVVFNICRRADDPINRFGVPEGFEQVRLVPGDVAPRASYHRPGSDVSNTKISKRRLDVDASVDGNVFLPLGAGAVVEISTSSKAAAVLLLPDGASRCDLRRLKDFRDYALKHARCWYAFINGVLGRMVESNALYLVTGVDKCSSWSVAAVENQSEDCQVSLKLKAFQVGSAGTTCVWEWEVASSFADSGPRRLPGEELWNDNQTVFLRGFKVAIRAPPLQRLSKALSIVDSKPSEILSKRGFIPYSRPSSSGTNSFSRSLIQPNDLSNSDDSEYVEHFPNSLAEFHPAHVINAYLLDSCPDAMVSITHDDEWGSVLNDDDEVPDDTELIERVLNKYEISFAQGGVWLGGCQLDLDSGPQPPLQHNLLSNSSSDNRDAMGQLRISNDSEMQDKAHESRTSPKPSFITSDTDIVTGLNPSPHPQSIPIAVHSDLAVDGSTSSESSDEESEPRVDSSEFSDEESEPRVDRPFSSAKENDDDDEELSSEDFPGYFSERNGRLFHSQANICSPYPLPVDTPEQERMNVQHNLLVRLLGAHFPASCPVPDVLAHDPERQKYVLDLCTGTGIWTMEMAEQFPHVAFRAIDIVPIATRYPLPNVQFTMQDVNSPTSWNAGTFDLVHGRSISMAVTSYATTLREVARLLRPGGLFLSVEWNRTAAFHHTYAPCTPETHAPAFTAFFSHVHAALTARGLPALPPPVPALLAADPAFTDITESKYYLPIGAWHQDAALKRLGRAFRHAVLRYATGFRPMFVEGGILSEEEMDEVYVNLERELRAVAGLVGVFRAVHARKV